MKKSYLKILYIVVMIFSLSIHTGCFIAIGENGEIIFDLNNNANALSCNYKNGESLNEEIMNASQDITYSSFLKGCINTKASVVETEHFIIELSENVYVPGYLGAYLEVIYDSLETVSGLTFYNEHYNSGKITLEVEKPSNEKFPESEVSCQAYAYSKGSKLHLCSGDLLIGNSYTITHELSHILQYSQSSWHYSRVYVEGFAEYTSYKVVKYLEQHYPQIAFAIDKATDHITNMSIQGDIYSQPIKYWIENYADAYDISFNGPYAVGFRFMDYLENVYGSCSNWIHYYENINPYYYNHKAAQEVNLQDQYDAMINTYGEDVFDNFYPWLKETASDALNIYDNVKVSRDLTAISHIYLYPFFYAGGNHTAISIFSYNNLYVNIDEMRNYLSVYKNKNVDELTLKLAYEVEVELYDKKDRLIKKETNDTFTLKGVNYIKLVGEGHFEKQYSYGMIFTY